MFERFTGSAREAVAYAQEVSVQAGLPGCPTSALLAGVVRDVPQQENAARKALLEIAAALERPVRIEMGDEAPSGLAGQAGEPPFTREASRALEDAFREALGMGHNWVAREHMLIALAAAPEASGSFQQIADWLGADEEPLVDRVRKAVISVLVSPDAAPQKVHGHVRRDERKPESRAMDAAVGAERLVERAVASLVAGEYVAAGAWWGLLRRHLEEYDKLLEDLGRTELREVVEGGGG